MNLLGILALVFYSFGAFAYGALARSPSNRTSGANPCRPSYIEVPRWNRIVARSMMVLCFVWFVTALFKTLILLSPDIESWPVRLAMVVEVFLFPPLIMHMTYLEARAKGVGRLDHPAWRWSIGGVYVVSQTISATFSLGVVGVLPISSNTLNRVGIFIALMFGISTAFGFLVNMRARKAVARGDDRREVVSTLDVDAVRGRACCSCSC